MEKNLQKVLDDVLIKPGVSGVLCADENGLCLASKGAIDASTSGSLVHLMKLAQKIEPSKVPINFYSTGFKCPYCDYSSMQSTFVHSHIKMHITPSGIHPPQAFVKFQSFKIVCRDEEGGTETTLYDDAHHKSPATQASRRVPVVVLSDILESASAVHKWNIRKQPSLVVKISKVDEQWKAHH